MKITETKTQEANHNNDTVFHKSEYSCEAVTLRTKPLRTVDGGHALVNKSKRRSPFLFVHCEHHGSNAHSRTCSLKRV